jgi:hypothetical protein
VENLRQQEDTQCPAVNGVVKIVQSSFALHDLLVASIIFAALISEQKFILGISLIDAATNLSREISSCAFQVINERKLIWFLALLLS